MRSDGYNIRMSLAEAKGCLQKKKSIFEDMSKNVRMNGVARLVRHHIKGEGQNLGENRMILDMSLNISAHFSEGIPELRAWHH